MGASIQASSNPAIPTKKELKQEDALLLLTQPLDHALTLAEPGTDSGAWVPTGFLIRARAHDGHQLTSPAKPRNGTGRLGMPSNPTNPQHRYSL